MTSELQHTSQEIKRASYSISAPSDSTETAAISEHVETIAARAAAAVAVPLRIESPATPKMRIPLLAIPPPTAQQQTEIQVAQVSKTVQQIARGGEVLSDIVGGPQSSSPSLDRIVTALVLAVKQRKPDDFARALREAATPQEAAEAVNELLKRFALRERKDDYSFIIDNLRQLFPAVNAYVKQIDIQGGKIDVLSSEGIRHIIQTLQDKEKITMPCILCENYSEFEEELRKFASSDNLKISFIVRNQELNATPPVTHASPICIEKTRSGYRCVITDSLGRGNIYSNMIANKANQFLKMLGGDYQIFCYLGQTRQTAQTNCPIFCIRDVVQFSRDPRLFQFCEKKARICTERHADPRVIFFDQLTPEMMKTTQSLTKIREFDATNPSSFPVLGSIQDHILEDQGKSWNNLIEERFLKYERLLIASVISGILPR